MQHRHEKQVEKGKEGKNRESQITVAQMVIEDNDFTST
jgi:hypothetical protein